MERLNIDKVAKLAHVSRSVVSRVINNHPNVSEEARARVMSIVNEYNYKPNSVARSLATQNTFQIGVLASRIGEESLGNGYWSLLYLGIFEECIRQGFYVRLSFYSTSMTKELHELILNEDHLDGVICLNEEVTAFTVQKFADQKIPVVMVGHNRNYPEISSVDVDNFSGAYKAVKYLTDLGHKQIGGIFGDQNFEEAENRIKGYKEALIDAGITLNSHYTSIVDYSQHSGYNTMNHFLDHYPEITAVFCASDTLAMGAILALHERAIQVPEHFSVVGFDGLPISKYMIPPLTTIEQPVYGKGVKAAELLINCIRGDHEAPVQVNLEPQLIVRKSCAPPLQ
jgi:DNA-binding LacI/PurR family transcriptional regulator